MQPICEPHGIQRSTHRLVSHREEDLRQVQGARPQLLIMAEAAGPTVSGSPPAEPALSEAEFFDKYLQKLKATAHFYEEGHAFKMAEVVNHLSISCTLASGIISKLTQPYTVWTPSC